MLVGHLMREMGISNSAAAAHALVRRQHRSLEALHLRGQCPGSFIQKQQSWGHVANRELAILFGHTPPHTTIRDEAHTRPLP